ncbi:MAG: glycosyl transferase [Bacteroidetes bacterium]|nr:glycosyl transferase [Bacteroidota bacterium]
MIHLMKDVPPEAEVIRFPIWEPYELFNRLSALAGKKQVKQTDLVATEKKSFIQRVSGWIRGNLFIPDARIFWVRPSVEFLSDILKSNQIHTLVTTGPPHSLHLIGLRLKKKFPELRWIADFRDPWSEWDLLDTFSMSAWAKRKHQRLERQVLQTADRVMTIAPYHVARLEQSGGRKVDLVTNGFDEDDFLIHQRRKTEQWTLRHIGMVDQLRDPRPFMLALKNVLVTQADMVKNVKVEFIGSVNSVFREFIAAEPVLSSVVRFTEPISHEKLLQTYGETDVQLLVLAHTAIAPGNLPGKLFEYLASGNFILGTGPASGDAADILSQTGAGVILERTDTEGMERVIRERYQHWLQGSDGPPRNVERFTRRRLTERLAAILEDRQIS